MNFDELKAVPGFWYLATPYSKYPAGRFMAFVDACRAAAKLIKDGVGVYSPIAHTHPISEAADMDPLAHEVWLAADRPMMDAACGLLVVMMPEWDKSYGIKEEIRIFHAAKKPIHFLPWE